ncbi:MAG: putative HD-superfamily hydrolase [Thermoleophilia bacterium]|nr:putative HD-superfamily hydrolase [Thermoleophilia bacterium]
MPHTIEQIRAEYEGAGGRSFHAEGRFAVVNCQFREGRGGRFAVVDLRDGTGSFTVRCFEAAIIEALVDAGAIDARLKVEEFNGNMSCVLSAYDVAQLDGDDIMRLAGLDPEVHAARVATLEGWLAECDGTIYGDVLRECFREEGTWEAFCMAAAAVRLHHAEPGGLVRHLVEVGSGGLALLDSTGADYDRPYFLAGVFLHDLGKLDTYTAPPTIAYTAEGQLGEHQIWSTFRLAKACAAIGAPRSVEARLLHIIEQAHGSHRHAEWQDPLGPEPKALAAADLFSSRLGQTEKERRSQVAMNRVVDGEASAQAAGGFDDLTGPSATPDAPTNVAAGLF